MDKRALTSECFFRSIAADASFRGRWYNLSITFFFQMEQLSDEELDHGAEEDSDKEDQDLDKMFGAWLGELDKLTQVGESPVTS